MEIEHLNKTQIVLLTFLVAFMTSIVTGIVTVSLMDQAAPAITQTVSKVVERTIEKAVPQQAAAAVAAPQTIEKTVYVKESDSISKAVDTASVSVVRLLSSDTENPAFIALAVVLDKNGLVVTDGTALGERADAAISIPGSKEVRMFVTSRDEASGLAYLSPGTTTSVVWRPATLATAHVTLGQSLVALAGRSVTRIGVGVVTALSSLAGGKDGVQVIETNIPTDGILAGSPIIDTAGNILGLSTGASRASSEKDFVTASALSVELKSASAAKNSAGAPAQ